jgi:hypothetical protein
MDVEKRFGDIAPHFVEEETGDICGKHCMVVIDLAL